MRSLMIATVMCAAMTFTGCSFTVSGPCTSLTHQSRLGGECGCNADSGCDSCTPSAMINSWGGQEECGPTNFGEGAPMGLQGMSLPRPNKGAFLARLGGGSEGCGCNEEVPCDGGCGDAGCGSTSMVSTGDQGITGRMGMGLFQKGTACSDGSCGLPAGLPGAGALRGRVGSRMHGAMGAVASKGCGRFGCGREGKLCLSCKGKLRSIVHGASSGPIPHTAQPPMGPAGAAPSYVYPYYTTRGPRDFLMANPPSIGY